MANIKFISGDGVEHEVEETSPAADHMRTSGFQRIYSEAEAAAQAAEESIESVESVESVKQPKPAAKKRKPKAE